jgi:hypothetical protein
MKEQNIQVSHHHLTHVTPLTAQNRPSQRKKCLAHLVTAVFEKEEKKGRMTGQSRLMQEGERCQWVNLPGP